MRLAQISVAKPGGFSDGFRSSWDPFKPPPEVVAEEARVRYDDAEPRPGTTTANAEEREEQPALA